jgi:diguanylate cyclase (GGDEF)-like protein
MDLDLNTLLLVTVYIEAMLGLLLLFAWVQNTQIYAVAWWGFSHLFRSASIVLFGLYGSASDLITIDLANAILFTAFAMTYVGARVFDGRPLQPVALVAGAVIWLLMSRTSFIADSLDARVLLSSGIITAYTWLTAYEFWRGRAEPLVSRIPAVFMLFAHGALYLLRTPILAFLPWTNQNQIFSSVWLTALSFEALLFTISIAFILLAMAKERTELRHKTAALIDPLTGIANRRAFLEQASDLLSRQSNPGRPWAVLLLDLDHFKSINDRFGHAIGDQILQIFAGTTQSKLGPQDLIGRLGGEEFAIVLCDANREKALAIAEQIRSTFAEAAATVDGCAVHSTVSVGVVVEEGHSADISTALSQADQALYYAKARGRNRVELASLDLVLDRARRRAPIQATTQSAA